MVHCGRLAHYDSVGEQSGHQAEDTRNPRDEPPTTPPPSAGFLEKELCFIDSGALGGRANDRHCGLGKSGITDLLWLGPCSKSRSTEQNRCPSTIRWPPKCDGPLPTVRPAPVSASLS